jgi:transcriptional regulator with XRE-family HTH domain
MNSDAFSDRLREAIGGRSLRSFGADCGLSEGALRKYLTEKSEPGMSALVSMARTAGVRIEWLATGDGPMRGKDLPPGGQGAIDREIMETTIRIIEEVFEEHDLELPPAKKAKLIMLLHDMFVQDEQKLNGAKRTIVELVKLAS